MRNTVEILENQTKGLKKSIYFIVDAKLLIRDVISIAIVFVARLLAV